MKQVQFHDFQFHIWCLITDISPLGWIIKIQIKANSKPHAILEQKIKFINCQLSCMLTFYANLISGPIVFTALQQSVSRV